MLNNRFSSGLFLRNSLLMMFVAIAITAYGQADAALRARLQHADSQSRLDDPALLPWHMKVEFQLYNEKGKPTESGTLEEWWLGKEYRKRRFESPSFTATIISNKDGVFQTANTPALPAALDTLEQQFFRPMDAEIDDTTLQPDLRSMNFGAVPMDCIMLDSPIKNAHALPLGLFTTFCLDKGKTSLRVSYNFGTQLILRKKIGVFQGKFVALDVSVMESDVVSSTATVTDLKSATLTEADFAVTPEMRRLNTNVVTLIEGPQSNIGLVKGKAIFSPMPPMPAQNIALQIYGNVVLKALIGTDGRVHDIHVVSTPDARLAIAAIAVVRQWKYQPATLNGTPVAVDDTISIPFQKHELQENMYSQGARGVLDYNNSLQ